MKNYAKIALIAVLLLVSAGSGFAAEVKVLAIDTKDAVKTAGDAVKSDAKTSSAAAKGSAKSKAADAKGSAKAKLVNVNIASEA